MAVAMLGGSVCAVGSYFIDGLIPVKMPDGCGEKKFLALSQYAMIGGFLVSVIHAIAISSFANMAIVAMIPLCFLGAYSAKQSVLHSTIAEKTKDLEKANKKLEENAAKMTRNLKTLKTEADDLSKLAKLRKEEADKMVKKLGEKEQQEKRFIEISKKIGKRFAENISQAKKVQERVESTKKDQNVIGEKVLKGAQRLDEENLEFEERLKLLDDVSDDIQEAQKETEQLYQNIIEANNELIRQGQTWQAEKVALIAVQNEEELRKTIQSMVEGVQEARGVLREFEEYKETKRGE